MASSLSSGPVLAASWQPQSDAEREALRNQLNRILASSVFRSSKRYPALLKFIVEETLEGRADTLKERVLGVEVFGRPPDYDTSSDHVVRTAAGEVRKRLAQYYLASGSGEDIRIEVPAGSYAAQFRLMQEGLTLVPLPKTPVARRGARWPLLLSLVANLTLIAALVVSIVPWRPGEAMLRKFWSPVFASPDPVQICVGVQDGSAAASTESGAYAISESPDPLRHRVSMAELLTLASITSYAGQLHARYRVLNPASTSLSDLRNQPTVLIGAGNNAWTKRLAGQLRFSFRVDDRNRPVEVLDKTAPQGHGWIRDLHPPADSFRDYAIVSRLLDPTIEQEVVMIGGLGPHGTEAAGEFVTSPDQIKKLEAYAPSGWAGRNLQIVLSTEVVKGSSGPPKIEVAWFW